jgi:hypothetical protein
MTPFALNYAIARSQDRERAARVNRPRPVTPPWWRRHGE